MQGWWYVIVKAGGGGLEGASEFGAYLPAKPKTEPRGFGFDLGCKPRLRGDAGGVQGVVYTVADEVVGQIQERRQGRAFGPANRKSSRMGSISVAFA